MTTHVCFLRAVNTGKRRITNDDLVAAARSIGLSDVTAYQASGNLLFRPDRSGGPSAEQLSRGLGEALGFDVPAIVRSSAQIEALLTADPFPGESPSPECRPQAIFLAEPIGDRTVADSFGNVDDRVAVVGPDLVWWPREGISTSTLDLAGLERALGTLTVRTVGTVRRIAERLS